MHPSFLNTPEFKHWLQAALAEDLGQGDVTSQLLIPPSRRAKMAFRNREPMVVAGLPLIAAVMQLLTDDFTLTLHAKDGDHLVEPQTFATLEGNAIALLSGERLALNLLQRCSGVATLTQRFVEMIEGTGVQILDTRKTIPSLRLLDKYSVKCGGGHNHRIRLDDRILIKDNHIAVCGGIDEAIRKAIAGNTQKLLIEVECDTLEQFQKALNHPIDWVLLDNMSLPQLAQAVALNAGKVKLEASGGVNLSTVRAIAETGVDAISVGALTHSAVAVDIGLDIEVEA